MLRRILITFCLCLGLVQLAWAGTYDEAAAAAQNRQYDKALVLFQKAIDENDDARAYNSLGTLYEKGLGVKQNYATAVKYYTQAAQKGNVKANGNLAVLYERGLGVKQDWGEAMGYYFTGLNNGDGKSMNNLGVMALNGEILPKNISVAWALFASAVNRHDKEAPHNLAVLESRMTKAEIEQGKVVYKALHQVNAKKLPMDIMLDYLGWHDTE
ncbi:MAG: sel1 repeat family protein [Snodgrassella sp.]|nr:sel1 repeat family protein [Snodgrassella sp.]